VRDHIAFAEFRRAAQRAGLRTFGLKNWQLCEARYLGNQGDLEIRWAPVPHAIIAFNFAGFEPGTFFKTVTYNPAPVAANIGFTYRS
jgi:hypothetical protein